MLHTVQDIKIIESQRSICESHITDMSEGHEHVASGYKLAKVREQKLPNMLTEEQALLVAFLSKA